ncbi:hypothetical protein WJT74_05105 [Sphingomicrobium sp. XHP0239]|uniref:Mom family adenine methylcarbamoylation protein n=1 Tax=Sphingomicrobium maritimum TaxID=3133972 RepID=UPI0031CC5B23
MSSKPTLRLDWATSEAAQYACRTWHYTGKMPNSGVKIGVWEDDKFIGVILFGVGAANATNGKAYGLARSHEIAELQRVALKAGHAYPVSKYVSIAIRMLRKQSPKLRMLISFADPAQGHHGGIYQAGNWIYTGRSGSDHAFRVKGEVLHCKTVHSRGWKQQVAWLRANIDPKAEKVVGEGKYRYLMALDAEIAERIAPLAKPYPKRAKEQASERPSELGGVTPTRTLQNT